MYMYIYMYVWSVIPLPQKEESYTKKRQNKLSSTVLPTVL